jgi:hypothetical protein
MRCCLALLLHSAQKGWTYAVRTPRTPGSKNPDEKRRKKRGLSAAMEREEKTPPFDGENREKK